MGRGRPSIEDKHYYDWKRVIDCMESEGFSKLSEAFRFLCEDGVYDYVYDEESKSIQRTRPISDPKILKTRYYEARKKMKDPQIAALWKQRREGYPDHRKRCVPTFLFEAHRILVPAAV